MAGSGSTRKSSGDPVSLFGAGGHVGALISSLRAGDRDYAAVFAGDLLVDGLVHYGGYWETPDVLGPGPGPTEFKVLTRTTEEIRASTEVVPG